MSRLSWHVSTGAVVVGWLLALAVVVLAHPFLPAPRWLMVHLLGLGAASNAILIWSWHFTVALLRLQDDDVRRGQVRRLVLFNAGALAVVAGTVSASWPAVLVGGGALAVAVLWHALALLRALRRALPSRFGATVRYYAAAGALLPVGVALGIVMARRDISGEAHAQLVVAHAAVNLLGWIGLTVLGTLVTLWPTMLRTRIAEQSELAARRMLPALVGGVLITAAGALGGVLLLTAGGLVLYLGALSAVLLAHRDEVRRKPPVEFATLSALAGMTWLAGSLLVLAIGTATADGWVAAADRAGTLTAPLLAGFVAQVLLGALSYLVPVVLGGGPAVVRAAGALLDRGATGRVTAANAALLVSVLPVPSLVRVLCSLVAFLALASFLPLLLRTLLTVRRLRAQPPAPAGPRQAPSARARSASAAAGLAVVVLAAAGGVALDPSALGVPGPSAAAAVPATGDTTTVEIRIEGIRFVPDVVEVPAGDRLVLVLANTGDDRHDLVLDSGAGTTRLSPEEVAELDVGVVGRELEGWCSVAGHRQRGMELHVKAKGAPEAHDP